MAPPTDCQNPSVDGVYAEFGFAMHVAQALEAQIMIAAPMAFGMHPSKTSRLQVDELWEGLACKTMGQNLARIRPEFKFPDRLDERLRQSLRLRNWLAHQFFQEHVADLVTVKGRCAMLSKLSDAAHFLAQVDSDLTAICEDWCRRIGISDEIVAGERAALENGLGGFPWLSKPKTA